MSKDCRDLLLRLLERSPDARITFAEFFSHSFVDLEHMPSAHSLVKAVRNERLHVCLFRMSINDVRHVIGCARALVLVPAPRSLSPADAAENCSSLHLVMCLFCLPRRSLSCRLLRRTRQDSGPLRSLFTAVPLSILSQLFTVRATSTLICVCVCDFSCDLGSIIITQQRK